MSDPTPPSTLAEQQRAVHAWISQWEEGYFHPLSNLARLTEEVGELARELNERHGDKPPADHRDRCEDAVADELGDILFVTITLANSLDIDLSQALQRVMDKYGVRDAQRFTPRTADHDD